MVADAGAQAELLFLPQEDEAPAEPNSSIVNGESPILAKRLASQLDGLIVSGGADFPAAMFGEQDIPKANIKPVNPARPRFELALLPEFLKRGKPVLGICYGCQLFNIWRGGTLIQDIPLQRPEAIDHREGQHTVRVAPGTRLHKIVGTEEFAVTTSHHQAVAKLARDAALAATAPDGIVEAIEFGDAPFFIGVQWHPECDRESEATQRLFSAFVNA